MIGAIRAGWDEIVGVEMEAQYIPIAHARLAYWSSNQLTLFDRDQFKPTLKVEDKPEDAEPGNWQLALF